LIDTTGKAVGSVLKWNGSKWVDSTDAGGTTTSVDSIRGLYVDTTGFKVDTMSVLGHNASKFKFRYTALYDSTGRYTASVGRLLSIDSTGTVRITAHDTSDVHSKATIRTLPYSVMLMDSLATSDTVMVGVTDGAIIDTIFYSMARSGSVTFRLELVDSLYQASGGTLIDTASTTLMRRKETGAAINSTTLTAGMILRLVFPTVGTEPKGIAVNIKGHY
jgi:hypothetical protein